MIEAALKFPTLKTLELAFYFLENQTLTIAILKVATDLKYKN